ncbi:hypothetical protein SUGI_0300880 [Cryptomeria japonica]|nr:hypothetical protein SUGI_0300880 [Cryptomeria japonica]
MQLEKEVIVFSSREKQSCVVGRFFSWRDKLTNHLNFNLKREDGVGEYSKIAQLPYELHYHMPVKYGREYREIVRHPREQLSKSMVEGIG